MGVTPHPRQARTAKVSAPARNVAEWFRQLDHLVHTARTTGPENPQVTHQVERLAESFASLVEYHAPLVLRVSPLEIWLRDELVVRGPEGVAEHEPIERRVPFILYRDGIRGLTFDANASREDARTLVSALAYVVGAPCSDHDLVTLLWRADLDGLRVEVAPIEPPSLVQTNEAPPEPAETLSVQTKDEPDWGAPVDARTAWRELRPGAAEAGAAWRAAWRAEMAHCWPDRVERLLDHVLATDDAPATREALSRSLTRWLAAAAQRNDWSEAVLAWSSLRYVDPDRRWSAARIADTLGALDAESIADRLDEGDRDTVARFFALAIRLGRPALDLVVRVLARSARQRVRAAATTALCYVCAEDPRALAPYLRDTRWHVARNIVFALGQLGGEDTAELLASGMRHPDARVRRAAVTALGQVPVHRRTPMLVPMLDGRDATTLGAVLSMLTREPDPRAAAAIAERVASADFESRPAEERLALIGALGEMGADAILPALERLLVSGGWFARRSAERTAAAHAIARIGTPAALALLHDGLRSRAEAVRTACFEALGRQEKSA